ncbi:hypothetical protein IscW_ISCW007513 [Ixodes scapularis]|uniref:Uncharacterized protein n=1 Tax=Ixodes scapularis TaxID=6945 RepID=B7PW31_IXOSC|nr:hypothetical protein IscW_ISCW007513 [Ixodes scapularis]|eukprot:XP_002409158.1 hypothetical protein IscW_ISCW007513 [Ixodes scapularis]
MWRFSSNGGCRHRTSGIRYRAAICYGLHCCDDSGARDAAMAVGGIHLTFFFFSDTLIFMIIGRYWYALTLCCQHLHQVSLGWGCARPERRWCARKQSPPPHDSGHIGALAPSKLGGCSHLAPGPGFSLGRLRN